jgi:hypothetical protein
MSSLSCTAFIVWHLFSYFGDGSLIGGKGVIVYDSYRSAGGFQPLNSRCTGASIGSIKPPNG